MIASIFFFALIGLVFIVSTTIIAMAVYPVEQSPVFLRPAVRYAQAFLNLLEEMFKTVDGPDPVRGARPIPRAPVPVIQGFETKTQPAPRRRIVDVDEERFFLLQEMAIHCKFNPNVQDGVLKLSKREYSRVVDYCSFAFDRPQTPQQVFTQVGLSIKKV